MKLDPIMKLIGKFTVLLIKKFTFPLLVLFWIAIINIQNSKVMHKKHTLYLHFKTQAI